MYNGTRIGERKMRQKKKNKLALVLIVLIATLGLGYAFLQTDLTINGTGKIAGSNWNIYFDNIQVTSGSATLQTGDSAPTINPTTLTDITYTITLKEPGEFYEFTVDVVNAGTLNAMVGTITKKINGTEISTTNPLPAYLNYAVTYSDDTSIEDNHLLSAGDTETYKVRLAFRTDINPSDLPTAGATLTLSFGVNYAQADENAVARSHGASPFVLPEGKTVNNLVTGDELCIEGSTTECFYLVSDTGDQLVLLAKYKLKVGREDYNLAYSTSTPGYGLQSSVLDYGGGVDFSYTNYWYDSANGRPYSNYGTTYPMDVYDSSFNVAPDFTRNDEEWFAVENYSIAYYVNLYKNTLESPEYGATIQSARLLTRSEATSLGCVFNDSYSSVNCPSNHFVRLSDYWLGTAGAYRTVWVLDEGGGYQSIYGYGAANLRITMTEIAGVRPVIIVSKSNI